MAASVVALALLAVTSPFVVAQEVDSKSDREAFAAQVIGTNMAFFEVRILPLVLNNRGYVLDLR